MLPLLWTEAGSIIRTMGEAGAAFLFGSLGFLVGVPIAIQAFRKSSLRSKRWLSITVLFLCVTPIPLASITLQIIAGICGFQLAE